MKYNKTILHELRKACEDNANTTTRLLGRLDTMLDDLAQEEETRNYIGMFRTELTLDQRSNIVLAEEHEVIFNDVVLDKMGNYYRDLKRWHCSYPGLYLFNYFVVIRNDDYLRCPETIIEAYLLVNGKGEREALRRSHFSDEGYHYFFCHSFITLKTGDRVSLYIKPNIGGVYIPSESGSYFRAFGTLPT